MTRHMLQNLNYTSYVSPYINCCVIWRINYFVYSCMWVQPSARSLESHDWLYHALIQSKKNYNRKWSLQKKQANSSKSREVNNMILINTTSKADTYMTIKLRILGYIKCSRLHNACNLWIRLLILIFIEKNIKSRQDLGF